MHLSSDLKLGILRNSCESRGGGFIYDERESRCFKGQWDKVYGNLAQVEYPNYSGTGRISNERAGEVFIFITIDFGSSFLKLHPGGNTIFSLQIYQLIQVRTAPYCVHFVYCVYLATITQIIQ